MAEGIYYGGVYCNRQTLDGVALMKTDVVRYFFLGPEFVQACVKLEHSNCLGRVRLLFSLEGISTFFRRIKC